MGRWNLFSKLIFIGLSLWVTPATAINIHALYTASCQREIGVILNVTPRQIFLLNLKGEIVSVERFEIIYYATYPLDVIPMSQVSNPEQVPLIEVKTRQNKQFVTLTRGWPVDFSKDKVSFLTLEGSEVVVDRASFWKLKFNREGQKVEFTKSNSGRYNFIHPYAFNTCEPDISGTTGDMVLISPQQLLSDPITIKREFDRLAEGHDGMKDYDKDQQFYAIPEVYKEETQLGIWTTAGSRYGRSTKRENNFTPFLVDKTSTGPFGFQSEFRTGSGPINIANHEETQTQVYYRLKADYFHFTGFVDPGLLLVGSKYQWNIQDLDGRDIRISDSAILEFGFDYGNWSIEFFTGGATNLGARIGDNFKRETMSFTRIGLMYQSADWIFEINNGSGEQEGFDLSTMRANVEWTPHPAQRYVLSLINRELNYFGLNDAQTRMFGVDSKAMTAAFYGYFRFKNRYWAGVMLAAENLERKYKLGISEESETELYPKGGVLFSLSF